MTDSSPGPARWRVHPKPLMGSYLFVAVVAGLLGAWLAWQAHPDGLEQRRFHGVVLNVDAEQQAIGVDTRDYGKVAGHLVHEGTPLRTGQKVSGTLYGPDARIIEVDGD